MTPHSRDLCSSVLATPPPGAFLFPLVRRLYQISLLIYFTNFVWLWIYLAIFTIPTINAIFSHLPFLSIILKYGTLFSISTEQKRQWWPRIVITAVTPRGSDPASASSNIRQQLGHQAPGTRHQPCGNANLDPGAWHGAG